MYGKIYRISDEGGGGGGGGGPGDSASLSAYVSFGGLLMRLQVGGYRSIYGIISNQKPTDCNEKAIRNHQIV